MTMGRLFEGAKRELAEECKLIGETWQKLGVFHMNPGLSSQRFHIFMVDDPTMLIESLDQDTGEETKVLMFPIDNSIALIQSGAIVGALIIAALALALL